MSVEYRLAAIKAAQGTQLVVERDGRMLPLDRLLAGAGALADIAPLLEDWAVWAKRIDAAVAAGAEAFASGGIAAADATFAVPLATPGNLICIGANYKDHIAEMAIPMTLTQPYSFLKPARNTSRASGEAVVAPRQIEMMDWEAELGVVIGKVCKDVSAADALSCVAGYMNFNDLSARDCLANRPAVGIDWVVHKAHDGFAPMGPYFVPAQFIPDPQDMAISLTVNDVVKQASSTGQMIFGVAEIIAHLSAVMTLYPGDVIATGTPAGTGHGLKPPEYLQPGDMVAMEIGPLGLLETPII